MSLFLLPVFVSFTFGRCIITAIFSVESNAILSKYEILESIYNSFLMRVYSDRKNLVVPLLFLLK